jgi:hypothetical protein
MTLATPAGRRLAGLDRHEEWPMRRVILLLLTIAIVAAAGAARHGARNSTAWRAEAAATTPISSKPETPFKL